MRALSLSQPWCWAVLFAGKHIENRTWRPPATLLKQRFAIHAAKSWDDSALTYMTSVGCVPPSMIKRDKVYPQGAIVGVATLHSYVDTLVPDPKNHPSLAPEQRKWFFGPFGWILEDVIPLTAPVPCRGHQGVFGLDPNVEEAVMSQLGMLVTLKQPKHPLKPSNPGVTTMVAIYDRPRDLPGGFAVRMWHINGQMIVPGKLLGSSLPDLETARVLVPDGLVNIGRFGDDEPTIVEVWL